MSQIFQRKGARGARERKEYFLKEALIKCLSYIRCTAKKSSIKRVVLTCYSECNFIQYV